MEFPRNVVCTKEFKYTTVAKSLNTDDECIKQWTIKEGTKGTVVHEDWRLTVTLETPIKDTGDYPYTSQLHRVFYKDIQSVLREWELQKEEHHED